MGRVVRSYVLEGGLVFGRGSVVVVGWRVEVGEDWWGGSGCFMVIFRGLRSG